MLNPLLHVQQEELHAQSEEVYFGIFEIDTYKGQYLAVFDLLESAHRTLEPPSEHRSRIALAGVARAAQLLKARAAEAAPKIKSKLQFQRTSSSTTQQRGTARERELLINREESIQSLGRYHSALSEPPDEEEESRPNSPGEKPDLRTIPFEDAFKTEIQRTENICKEKINALSEMLNVATRALQQASANVTSSQANAIRVELKDIYRQLYQVSQFVIANHTMATRLLHAKVVVNSRFGPKIRSELQRFVRKEFVQTEEQVRVLTIRVENMFATYFGLGDADVARFELVHYLSAAKHEIDSPMAALLGFVLASLLFTLAFVFFTFSGFTLLEKEKLSRVYRGLAVVGMVPWLNLFVIFMLRQHRINYVLLFDMDIQTKNYHNLKRTAVRACGSTLCLLLSLITCLAALHGGYRRLAWFCPTILLPIYVTAVYMSPMSSLSSRTISWRNWFFSLFGLGHVTFAVVFRTDLYTSFAKTLGDLARLCCHVLTFNDWMTLEPDERTCETSYFLNSMIIPFLAFYPLWLRMVQNLQLSYERRVSWPFFFNAIKYAIAIQVVVISSFRSGFIASSALFQTIFVANSIVASTWDIFMDFGLGRLKYYGLRDRLMYKHRWFYYGVMLLDIILRFAWTLTLVASGYITASSHPVLLPVGPNSPVTFFEMFRRTLWCLVRIENEHLSNTSQFREIDFVPLYFYEDEKRAERGSSDEYENAFENHTKAWVLAFLRVVLMIFGVVSLSTWILQNY